MRPRRSINPHWDGEERRERIVRHVRAHPGCHVACLSRQLGVSRENAIRHVEKLLHARRLILARTATGPGQLARVGLHASRPRVVDTESYTTEPPGAWGRAILQRALGNLTPPPADNPVAPAAASTSWGRAIIQRVLDEPNGGEPA